MMARRGWSRLRIDQRGAAVIELALVLPMVIMFIFGLIEGARAIWTFQTLQETAFKAARCMVIGRTPCESTDDARNYAVAIAGQSNITRSEEHTSELQSLMRNSYAVSCLKKTKKKQTIY